MVVKSIGYQFCNTAETVSLRARRGRGLAHKTDQSDKGEH
jgi:hypothetical protein